MTPQDRVLQKYVDTGAYVLFIENGTGKYHPLTDQVQWSSIVKPGVTIVMSIIMIQAARVEFQCPFCDSWSPKENNVVSVNWWAFCCSLSL